MCFCADVRVCVRSPQKNPSDAAIPFKAESGVTELMLVVELPLVLEI